MGLFKRDRPGKPPNHPPVVLEETGQVFETYTEAAEAVGGSRFGVMKTAYGIQGHHHGKHFSFIDGYEKWLAIKRRK